MKELIKTLLGDIIRKISPDFKDEVLVEIPENKEHGDYTSSVAFSLAKILHKLPQVIAEELAKKIHPPSRRRKTEEFSKVEAENGFINFYLSPECLYHQLKEILKQKNNYGKSIFRLAHGKRINVEFVSANPTGPLTIGNGRGGFYGDVLANVLETQGYEVAREYYINDRGEQVRNLGLSIKMAQGEKTLGATKYLYHGEYIKDLATEIDKKLNAEEAGQEAVKLVLKKHIKPIIKKLNIKYDIWFSEASLYKNGAYKKVMENLMQSDFIYEKDGATWMKTSGLGDSEDRVLVKSDGGETYFLSDILYHYDKFKVRKFDKVVNIWGADHHGYAPRLKAAVAALGVSEESLDIIITQLVRLTSGGKEVKVSKRAGTFITLEKLIDEVGLDAARFFFLMYSPNTHMNFDMALAKERSQKNPVYYVQYAHARLSSILGKARKANYKLQIINYKQSSKSQFLNIKLLKTKADLSLIRKLVEFPEVLSDIVKNYEVHRLPRYALELAREFHNFYEKERVITEDKKLTSARLTLIMAAKIILANTLNLMGIDNPDKM